MMLFIILFSCSQSFIFCRSGLYSISVTSLQVVSIHNFVQAGFGVGSILIDDIAGWRYMYSASTPLALIMGFGMWWLPHSPRWLLLRAIQGKGNVHDLKEAAILCLRRLRGPSIGELASKQVDEVMAELYHAGEEKVTMREIFQGKCLKALIIGAGLVFFQQVIIFLKQQNPNA